MEHLCCIHFNIALLEELLESLILFLCSFSPWLTSTEYQYHHGSSMPTKNAVVLRICKGLKVKKFVGFFSLSKVLVTDKIPSLKGALAKKEMDTTVCQLYTPRGNY